MKLDTVIKIVKIVGTVGTLAITAASGWVQRKENEKILAKLVEEKLKK